MATKEPIDVFAQYDMTGGPTACWPYIGSAWGGRPNDQRPYFMSRGRRQVSYRWIYELYHGVVLRADQLILHSCDNGSWPIACGNVHHMRIGTTEENTMDMTSRQRHGLPHNVVRAIRKLLDDGDKTQEEIAATFGVSRETISAIATQRTYKHLKD